MAKDPAQFDVIVTTNLAGDIISDLASGLVGGLGFAASGNYGDDVAIFEAVHGSAPKYAGKNVINPTALILSSVMMLRHLGEQAAAQRIEDAVFVTLEEGQAVTLDVARQTGDVEQATSTSGFTDAIIANLGRAPDDALPGPRRGAARAPPPAPRAALGRRRPVASAATTRVVGVDVYVEADEEPGCAGRDARGPGRPRLPAPAHLGARAPWSTRRDARVDTVGWWRCRFVAAADGRGRRRRRARCALLERDRRARDLDARPEAAHLRRRGGLHARPGPVAARRRLGGAG